MAHRIHGIITSFAYDGELPNIVLVGNYHFLPFINTYGTNYSDTILEPYEELTKEIRKILKELSFTGKCAYVETDYFGGYGTQLSEAWFHGKRIIGPLISIDGIEDMNLPSGTTLVENSINESLKTIGVYRHEGKDEFDSVRLGQYRLNESMIEEYKRTKSIGK